jgi:hypothetical protein
MRAVGENSLPPLGGEVERETDQAKEELFNSAIDAQQGNRSFILPDAEKKGPVRILNDYVFAVQRLENCVRKTKRTRTGRARSRARLDQYRSGRDHNL